MIHNDIACSKLGVSSMKLWRKHVMLLTTFACMILKIGSSILLLRACCSFRELGFTKWMYRILLHYIITENLMCLITRRIVNIQCEWIPSRKWDLKGRCHSSTQTSCAVLLCVVNLGLSYILSVFSIIVNFGISSLLWVSFESPSHFKIVAGYVQPLWYI